MIKAPVFALQRGAPPAVRWTVLAPERIECTTMLRALSSRQTRHPDPDQEPADAP